MSYWEGYPPYVSVGERRAKAEAKLKKLQKSNPHVQPVVLTGSAIAATWWGKSWNRNLERYADYTNRIGRGRSYVRHGAVLDLQIRTGEVRALVQGTRSQPYAVNIEIQKLAPRRWEDVKSACAGRLASLPELLAGKFPRDLGEIFMASGQGLFPEPQEIRFSCSCPDWAYMCKHVAAALYGIGARLDNDPGLFFTLRGIEVRELITAAVTDTTKEFLKKAGRQSRRVLIGVDLSEVFGIDLDDGTGDAPPTPQPGTHSDAGLERPMGKPRHFFGDAAAPPPQPVKAPGAPSLSGPRKQPTGRSSPSPAKEAQKPTGRTKRAPVAALTPMELVEQLILKSRKGIDTATLVKKTGLSAPQIRSIVQRLRMQGRIATLARGIYGKAPI